MTKPVQFTAWPAAIHPGYGPYRTVCERVVDGDTLYAFCDLGLNSYAYVSVRLKDVSAPELFSGTDKAAGAAARDYLTEICPPGTKLLMYTFKDSTSFGRYIAVLRREDLASINELMNHWLSQQIGGA